MTAPVRPVAAALLRAGLAAAVLAIIAGIFGMHVMTGNHAAHGSHAAAAQVGGSHAAAAQVGGSHAHAQHPGAHHAEAYHAEAAGITSCPGSCPRAQEAGAACVPSAKAGVLTVFPPHENRLVFNAAPGSRTGPAATYAHTPPSPTPSDLSISRT